MNLLRLHPSLSHSPKPIPSRTLSKNYTTYTPQSSYVQQVLDFTKNDRLKEKYFSIHGSCRIGRLLESLDIISGACAYKYILGDEYSSFVDESRENLFRKTVPTRDSYLVTASCSELKLLDGIGLESDLMLDAKVQYVGKTSMEIDVGVFSVMDLKRKLISASFTYVAVSESGYSLPPLVVETEEERLNEQIAKQNKLLKIQRAKKIMSYEGKEDVDSNVILRNLLNVFPDADLKCTSLKTYSVMHQEHKNIHGKIFGGFLMRQGAELAWACASLCTKKLPQFKTIKEQIFLIPVEVGDFCLFNAQIVSVEQNEVHVLVSVTVVKPMSNAKLLSNQFYYEFLCE